MSTDPMHRDFMGVRSSEQIARDTSVAKELLERADAKELYALYQKRLHDIDKLTQAFNALVDHYAHRTAESRLTMPSDNAVAAMERVALAAIDLGRAVVSRIAIPGIGEGEQ